MIDTIAFMINQIAKIDKKKMWKRKVCDDIFGIISISPKISARLRGPFRR